MVGPVAYLCAAAAAGGLVLGLGIQQLRIQGYQNDALQAEKDHLVAIKKVEDDWKAKGEKADDYWAKRNLEYLDALDDAATERDGLRDTLARFKSKHSCPPSPGQAKPTEDPIGVLANVLSRADAAAEVYAKTADQRGNTGQLCEQRYDALRVK